MSDVIAKTGSGTNVVASLNPTGTIKASVVTNSAKAVVQSGTTVKAVLGNNLIISGSGGSGGILSGATNPTGQPANIPSLYINTTTRKIWEWATGATSWSLNTLSLDDLDDVAINDQPVVTYTQLGSTGDVYSFGQASYQSVNRWVILTNMSATDLAKLTAGTIVTQASGSTNTFTVLATAGTGNPGEAYIYFSDSLSPTRTWTGNSIWVVNTTALVDGEVLTYNATSQKWEARAPSGGGGSIPYSGNGITGSTVPKSIVLGSNLSGAVSGGQLTLSSPTTNTLSAAGNVLTSTVNGIARTANTIQTNAIVKTTNHIQTVVNDIGSAATQLVDTVALSAGVGANTLKATVNGVDSNEFTLPATGVTIAQVDAEIANLVGSVTPVRTRVSNGTSGTTVIINQVIGQPVQMTVSTTTDAATIASALTAGGQYTIANTVTDGSTLTVQSWSSNVFQVVATFPSTTTLAQVQALFSGARSDSVYAGTALAGQFAFQSAPANAVTRLASTAAQANSPIFDLGGVYNADNVGLLVKINNTTAAGYSRATATIDSIGDFSSLTVTVPAVTAGYNTEFIGITAPDGYSWGGVGRIASGRIGIENIAWVRQPTTTGTFAQCRLYQVVDNVSNVYIGTGTDATVAQAAGGFSTILIQNAGTTITTVSDNIGGQAALVTIPAGGASVSYSGTGITGSTTPTSIVLSSGLTGTVSGNQLTLTSEGGGGTTTGSPWTVFTASAGQRTFTLGAGFTTDASIVVLNGATLIPTDDYSISGTTLTLDVSIPVALGDKVYVAATGTSGGGSAGVSSLNSLTGAVNIFSPDSSITVGTVGNLVSLTTAASGGAGVATGYNVGVYNPVSTGIAAGSNPTFSTAANEGAVQVGTGSGYSTNTTVLSAASAGSPSNGWTFGGQTANNAVFELSAQRQRFRLGVSGTWSLIPAYGSLAVIKEPIFVKYQTDYDTGAGLFPGLITASGSAAPLTERATVTPTTRYCSNLGFTAITGTFAGQAGAIGVTSTADVAGVATEVVVFGSSTPLTQANFGSSSGRVTLPLEVFYGGTWQYIGSEWQISAYTLDPTNQIQLTLDYGIGDGEAIRIAGGLSTPLLAWFSGLPPVGTQFGVTTATAGGYVEVDLPPNVWVGDTINYKPNGFSLPTTASAPNGYNFSWAVTTGTQVLNTLQYWHYVSDPFNGTDALPNWNNRITVNYGSSGSSIPGNLWDTWAINWAEAPLELVTDGTATDGTVSGDVVEYIYGGVTRYRFIPNQYLPNRDAFYSTYTPATKTVSSLLTARSS